MNFAEAMELVELEDRYGYYRANVYWHTTRGAKMELRASKEIRDAFARLIDKIKKDRLISIRYSRPKPYPKPINRHQRRANAAINRKK